MEKKKCNDCGETKKLTEFYSQRRTNANGESYTYYRPDCKECTKKSSAKWIENNKDRRNELNRKYYRTERGRMMRRKADRKRRADGRWYRWLKENNYKYEKFNKTHEISDSEWESCKSYFDYSCAYCGIEEDIAKKQQGQYLHKEHVKHDGANDLSNCVPSCKVCNSLKYNFDFEYWCKERSGNFSLDRFNKINRWLDHDYKLYIEN